MKTDTALTPEELHVLRHSLGLDMHGRGRQYRNHYCTGEGSTCWPTIQTLITKGLMVAGHTQSSGNNFFHVTREGKRMAVLGVKPLKIPKARRRYHKWCEVAEVCPDLTFREFLTAPAFAESRRNC